MASRRLPLCVLAVILVGGSYTRVANLGDRLFGVDELDHYYVAQSLESGDGPLLPSGRAYTRGIDYSRFVQLAARFERKPERAARLPSATLGILGLIVFSAIAWSIGGPWVAVWSSLLLAIFPEAVEQARQARFYTYQLLFGLVAFYAGWMALRRTAAREPPTRAEIRSTWAWSIIVFGALAWAMRIHVTTVSIVAGLMTCLAIAAIADIAARGWKSWSRSVPVQISVAGAVAGIVYLLANPAGVSDLLAKSQSVPYWASGGWGSLYYYYGLVEALPLVVSLSPLIFLVVALRNVRLAAYLAIWFGVPVLLHSVAFPWKGERFVLLAMPALLLATAIAATRGAETLWRLLHNAVCRLGFKASHARWSATAAVVLVSVAAIITTPAFNLARKAPSKRRSPQWPEVANILNERRDLRDVPLGSTVPIQALYYWGHVDFGVERNLLEDCCRNPWERDENGNQAGFRWRAMGSPGRYTGVPILTTPEGIRGWFPEANSVLIGVDSIRWEWGGIDSTLRSVLAADANELCGARCGPLMLFHWRFPGGARGTKGGD